MKELHIEWPVALALGVVGIAAVYSFWHSDHREKPAVEVSERQTKASAEKAAQAMKEFSEPQGPAYTAQTPEQIRQAMYCGDSPPPGKPPAGVTCPKK